MTWIAQMFEEEKQEALKQKTEEVTEKVTAEVTVSVTNSLKRLSPKTCFEAEIPLRKW